MNILNLTISQQGFRSIPQIEGMVRFVAEGGFFTLATLKDPRLISIVEFEDGRRFIHDGHHRIAAIYLAGRKELREDEFLLSQWTYEQYRDINLSLRWITPFDPRFQVRACDYEKYKQHIWFVHSEFGESEACLEIKKRCHIYLRPRRSLSIQDMLREIDG